MKQQLFQFVDKYKLYVGILLFFIVWMLFFDEYNWIRIKRDNYKLKSLKKEAVYLEQKIKTDRDKLDALRNDPEELEKFAREEYYMKRANEDIFVIIEE
jgi:cell division protein DivIC